jgi:hypothetical protein
MSRSTGNQKNDEPSAPLLSNNHAIVVTSTAPLTEDYFTKSFIKRQINKFEEADKKAHTSTSVYGGLRREEQKLRTALHGLKRDDTQGFQNLINLLDAGALFKQYIPVYQSIHDDIKKRVEADLVGPFHDFLFPAQHGGSGGHAKEAVTDYGTHTPVASAVPVPTKPPSFFQHVLRQPPYTYHTTPFFHPHFVSKQMQKIASVNNGLSAREADRIPTDQWADKVRCKALELALLSLKRADLPGFNELISTLKKHSYGERNPLYEKAYRSILHDVKQYVEADQAGPYYNELKRQDELEKKLCCDGYANYCLSAACCLWSVPYYATVLTWCCCCCEGGDCYGDPPHHYYSEVDCMHPIASAALLFKRAEASLKESSNLREGNGVNENAATHVQASCCCI